MPSPIAVEDAPQTSATPTPVAIEDAPAPRPVAVADDDTQREFEHQLRDSLKNITSRNTSLVKGMTPDAATKFQADWESRIADMTPADLRNHYMAQSRDYESRVERNASNLISSGTAFSKPSHLEDVNDTEMADARARAQQRLVQAAQEHVKANPRGGYAAFNESYAQGLNSGLVGGALNKVLGTDTDAQTAYNIARDAEHPYWRSVGSNVGQLGKPENVALMLATGGLSGAPAVAANVGGFSALQTLEQAQRGEQMTPVKNLATNAALFGAAELGGPVGNALAQGRGMVAGTAARFGAKALAGAGANVGMVAAENAMNGQPTTGPQAVGAAIGGALPAFMGAPEDIRTQQDQVTARHALIGSLIEQHGLDSANATRIANDILSNKQTGVATFRNPNVEGRPNEGNFFDYTADKTFPSEAALPRPIAVENEPVAVPQPTPAEMKPSEFGGYPEQQPIMEASNAPIQAEAPKESADGPRNPVEERNVAGGEDAAKPVPVVEKGVGDVVSKEGSSTGNKPGNVGEEVNAAKPVAVETAKTVEQLANDPLTKWAEVNDPQLAERMKRGELSAKEYVDTMSRMKSPATAETEKGFTSSPAKEPWQMTAKDFYKKYTYQHSLLRDDGEQSRLQLEKEGFKLRSGHNLASITGGPPNFSSRKYPTEKGKRVYAIPGKAFKAGTRGPIVKPGHIPLASESAIPIRRGEPVHEAIVREAISSGKPVPPEVLADYPELAKQTPTANVGASKAIEGGGAEKGSTENPVIQGEPNAVQKRSPAKEVLRNPEPAQVRQGVREGHAESVAEPSRKAEAPQGLGSARADETRKVKALHRETSPDEARDILKSSTAIGTETSPPTIHFASSRDLATGQGANKGVRMEFEPSFATTEKTDKPSAAFASQQGLKEFTASPTRKEMRQALKAVEVPKAVADNKDPLTRIAGLTRELNRLQKEGWTRTDTGDVARFEKPKNIGPGAADVSDPNFTALNNERHAVPDDAPRTLAAVTSIPAAEAREQTITSRVLAGATDLYKNASKAVREQVNNTRDELKRYGQKAFPKLNGISNEVSERASAMVAAKQSVPRFLDAWNAHLDAIAKEHGMAKDEFYKKVGAVATEDQLRGIRDGYIKDAKELRAKAASAKTPEQAEQLNAEASEAEKAVKQVKTIIGAPDSSLKSEAEYKAALNDPAVTDAMTFYRSYVEPMLSDYFKASSKWNLKDENGIDIEPPKRGTDTGTHVSLFPITEGETPTKVGLPKGGNIKNTLEKHSVLERKATGAADRYELDFRKILDNALTKSITAGTHAKFYKSLVDAGLAVESQSGQRPELDGQPTISVPLKFWHRQTNFNIRADVMPEVRRALAIDQTQQLFPKVGGMLTQAQLASGVEAANHIANQITALIKTPLAGGAVSEAAEKVNPTLGKAVRIAENLPVAKVAGILDTVGTKALRLVFRDPQTLSELADVSSIGALQPPHEGKKYNPLTWSSKAVQVITNAGRLALNDAFKQLAAEYPSIDTNANRRDFINQLGNYSKESSAFLVKTVKDFGIGPFATAGSAMYSQALRDVQAFKPQIPLPAKANAKMRLYAAAQVASLVAMAGLANYMRTGKMMPDGIPVGSIYLHDDKDGKPVYFDPQELTGMRRAERALGADAIIEGKRLDRPMNQMIDRTVRQAGSAITSPYAGAGINALSEGITGTNLHGWYHAAPEAKKDQSQQALNWKQALQDVNPVVSDQMSKQGGSFFDQLGKFSPRTGYGPDEREKIRRPAMIDRMVEDRRSGKSVDVSNLTKAEREVIKERSAFSNDDAYKFAHSPIEDRVKKLEENPAIANEKVRRVSPEQAMRGAGTTYLAIAREGIRESKSLKPDEKRALLERLSKLKAKE